MKAAVVVVCAGIAVLAFTGRLGFSADSGRNPAAKRGDGIRSVNDVFEKALRAGEPADPGTPAGKLNRLCKLREERLSALKRPAGLTGARPHALRVLAILRAHSRAASEPADVRALDLEQQRIIQRLAHAVGRGDYRATHAESLALRELAGRANATFMRLRLTNCLIKPSGIPL